MTYPVRTLFACWLTVVATGTDVAHCHAAAPGHGLGLVSVDCPVAGSLPTAHRHFVLCGVEFGAGEADPTDTPEGARPVLAADAPPAHDTAADVGSLFAHLDFMAAPFGLWSLDGRGAVRTGSPTSPPSPASATRSTVLRL